MDQPARLLLRLYGPQHGPAEHVFPAAAFGRGRWIGRMPRILARIEILDANENEAGVRIDAVVAMSGLQVARQLLLKSPLSIPGFVWQRLAPIRRRAVRVQSALDLAPLEAVQSYADERCRPFEPEGLDAGLLIASIRKPELGFVMEVPGGESSDESIANLLATLASIEEQTDPGSCVTVVAAPAVAEAARARIGRLAPSLSVAIEAASGTPETAARHAALCCPAPWVAHLRPGDRLARDAVAIMRDFIAKRPDLLAAYADSAIHDGAGRMTQPHLKPDWSPEFSRNRDYVGRPCFFRVATLQARGSEERTGWQILNGLAGSVQPMAIGHCRRILLTIPAGRSTDAPAPSMSPRAVARSGLHSSIVIPTRDRAGLLQRVVGSLDVHIDRDRFDLVVVDNGSTTPDALRYLAELALSPNVTLVRSPGKFNFSHLVNEGAKVARGEILILLNNDCEALDASWLDAMAYLAKQPDVGAVGAKLLYSDRTLQHAGVGIGLGGEAGHRNRGMPEDHPGHLDRLTAVHEVSAVTGACLAVERRKFEAAGGFDTALPVAFNDVDFCLRLRALGYRNLLTPHAVLLHLESASRGSDAVRRRRVRWQAEARLFRERWQHVILDDPYMHPLMTQARFYEALG